MPYEHEIFISYRRSTTVGHWVQRHLAPRLQARLDDVAPTPVRIFFDSQMENGVNLPEDLKRNIVASGLLLPVWSADYFRSAWCMAEWQSFRKREEKLGYFSSANPASLVYPVRYADGTSFHPDAQIALCRKDFSQLNYPDESFRKSVRYLQFDDLVREVAEELIARIPMLPPWDATFPIVEPAPLPAAKIGRPVI
jgi:hypothetical protein